MNEIDNNDEKLSAFYDGEIADNEVNDILSKVSDDKTIQNKIFRYGLISAAISRDSKIVKLQNKKTLHINPWISNAATAAASVLLTLFFINQSDLLRYGTDQSANKEIALAIQSEEAKLIADRDNSVLVDHVMNIINNPEYMNNQNNFDLTNVGFSSQKGSGYKFYTNGSQNFLMRIEKNKFGITKVKYWKHGNKSIFVIPLNNEQTMTLYGNITADNAIKIANSIR